MSSINYPPPQAGYPQPQQGGPAFAAQLPPPALGPAQGAAYAPPAYAAAPTAPGAGYGAPVPYDPSALGAQQGAAPPTMLAAQGGPPAQPLQPVQPTRLEENRPAPLATPDPAQPPARRSLFNLFRRGGGQDAAAAAAQQGPAPAAGPAQELDPESGGVLPPPMGVQPGQPLVGPDGAPAPPPPIGQPQQPSIMQNVAEKEGGLDVAMVGYLRSYRVRPDDPAISSTVMMHFDTRLGEPLPLPARLTAMLEGRVQREELGLYKENQCILSAHSLKKLEQRVVKNTNLDRNLLREMDAGSKEAAAAQAAIVAQKQQQVQQQQQLVVGALPTVTEEPEGPQQEPGTAPDAAAAAAQQLQQLQLQGQPQQALPQPPPGAHGMQTLPQQQGPPGENKLMAGAMAPRPIADPMHAYEWLDENGLMIYVPDPIKADAERPARRYDQDKEMNRTYVRRPIVENPAALRNTRMYRMDIELGRLEFTVHPAMAQEDLLAAKLLFLFREFKRREAVGLVLFYANRLAALEDSLLGAREKLFALQATEAATDDVLDAYAMLAKIEREVVEVRQLKEEEETLMTRTVKAMEGLYGQLSSVRSQQGYWLTNLSLIVQQQPPVELGWQQGALTRERLDALLLAAEMEDIAGLPKFPEGMPTPLAAELPGFRLRRLEAMCAAHGLYFADLTSRLEALKNRPSADAEDPQLKELEDQAMLIGRAPRRVAMTAEEQLALQQRAYDMVQAGQIGVIRMPRLVPILSIGQSPQSFMAAGGMPGGPGMPPVPGDPNGGALAPPAQAAARPAAKANQQGNKGKYFARLFVNGHYVDTTENITLSDNFVAEFRNVFSVQVSRFPESITVQLFERALLREIFISQAFIAVPGQAGTPHVDSQPRSYQFCAVSPFRPRQNNNTGNVVPLMPDGNADPSYNFNAIYPAGTIFVRCGWVSARTSAGVRLADAVGHTMLTNAYDNPLADHPDIEAGKDLMPPQPNITIDRMLRRAADRIGGRANRAQIMKWLAQNIIDPNDPRNAPLLELLKTHEAASGALGDLFRLDIFPDVAMQEDRSAEKRFNMVSRRWQSGIYRAPDKNLLKGVRSVALRAPLTAEETEQLDNQYLDQLSLLEQAGGGTQLALARLMLARNEKAMQLQIGALLSTAVKEREERVRAFALRVRAAAARLAGGATMARRFRTEDVVNDAPLPEFKLELTALNALIAPRRPLKRSRKLIKSLMTSVPRDTQLMVTIQRAANLPVRGTQEASQPQQPSARDERGRDNAQQAGRQDSSQRNCFVEVRFRGITKRTVSVTGEFPLFNEQLDLDVFRDDGRDRREGGDDGALEPSPSALHENSDLITINVFDEIIVERSEPLTLRRREAEVSDPVRLPERERRFLGCIRIPLSSVYQLQVLEGTFKLEAPPVVLGYMQASERPATLSMYMTLRPRLAPPTSEVDERVVSGEQDDVNRHAQRWMAGLLERPQCRSRVIRTMAVDADGSALLMCRYVAPAPLPPALAAAANGGGGDQLPGITALEGLMLRVARFVAHVPYMDDSGLQKKRNDIWTTNAEFMHMTGGDFEEHAHLLASYFLQLGQQCFIVLGASTAGARSSFVLTTGQPVADSYNPQAPAPSFDLRALQLRLWNPVLGAMVSIKDATGDMREVGVVYNAANIWANTQPTGQPWAMDWNLNNRSAWQTFFGPPLPPRELGTIQTAPTYEELDRRFYEELEGRVEKKVEEALSNARASGAFVTRPDNKVSRLLKQLLRELPKASEAIAAASLAASGDMADSSSKPAANPTGPTERLARFGERHKLITGLQASHNERIRREAKAEAVNGHILALPFSDTYLEAITEAVINTGIHRIADDRVRYSTAVYVEPLGASFVCCMWIYVAAVRGG